MTRAPHADDELAARAAAPRAAACAAAAGPVRELDRRALARHLRDLDGWLLPDSCYGVVHTWPHVYRSDGDGRFFALTDGEALLSHVATRIVTVHGRDGAFAACLLGSVATTPERRGEGLAGRVLQAALAANAATAAHTFLWAERPELYARAGFRLGPPETCLALARRPRPELTGVRLATVHDHAALHALHERRPWRVARTRHVMSAQLGTPGMATVVLERDGAVVAYACCGKGADLQGHWHDLGGSDDDLALLLPAALHVIERTEAVLLLPPYRERLRALLGRSVVGVGEVPGPMWRGPGDAPPVCWIDGLDSV